MCQAVGCLGLVSWRHCSTCGHCRPLSSWNCLTQLQPAGMQRATSCQHDSLGREGLLKGRTLPRQPVLPPPAARQAGLIQHHVQARVSQQQQVHLHPRHQLPAAAWVAVRQPSVAAQLPKDWSLVCGAVSAGRLLQAVLAAAGQRLMCTGSTLSTAAQRLVSRCLACCQVCLQVRPTLRWCAVLSTSKAFIYLPHNCFPPTSMLC